MSWDGIQASGTVIDFDEWNAMTNAIQHKGSEYAKYNQFYEGTTSLLRARVVGNDVYLEGGDGTTNADMVIKANQSDNEPCFVMNKAGSCYIQTATTQSFFIYDAASQVFRFKRTAGHSYLYGGDSASQALYLYANYADTITSIAINGQEDININTIAGKTVNMYMGGTMAFAFSNDSNCSYIWGVLLIQMILN